MPSLDEILALDSGAKWFKADLHVHTPQSLDIADAWKNATPQDLIRISLEKHLDIVAITDHNTAGWCDQVQAAAKGTPLTVFPGVEISTHQGHVIAIFDKDTTQRKIEDLLRILEIPYNQFGSLDFASSKGIVEVSQEIEKEDGIAIAAHVDGERGFTRVIRVGDEKKRAYNAPDLRALEVIDPTLRECYQRGKASPYTRRLACIQSSDSMTSGNNKHTLDSIGNRFTFFKMDKPSLAGLKLALIDPEMRIRLQNDDQLSQIDMIVGMWITGGFLNGQKFRFNQNVNCFIGDTGAGKSLTIELIRFCLDQTPRVEKIRKEVESLLKEQLGNLNTVHLYVKKGDAYYLIERSWGIPTTTPIVQRVSPTGLEQIQGLQDLNTFFPIKAFSQSEIIEFAREPEVRLSLTDDLIDTTLEASTIKDLKVSLRKNSSDICIEQAKRINILNELKELPNLLEARSQLDKTLNDSVIKQHHIWYEEQAFLKDAQGQFIGLGKKLETNSSNITIPSLLPSELETYPNKDIMKDLKSLYDGWGKSITGLTESMNTNLVSAQESLSLLTAKWKTRFDIAEEEYRKLLALMDKDGIGLQALSERRQSIETQISKLEKRKTELDTEINPRMKTLQDEREAFLTQLQTNRRAITVKRETKARELTEKLANVVRIHVHPRSNVSKYKSVLLQIIQGARLQAGDIDSLSKCYPITLVKNLLANDFEKLSNETRVEQPKLTKLWETIIDRKRLDDLYEMQLTDVEDVIEVMLNVENGEYKTIETLAHGQKCMVILMIALAEGSSPFLVDQPEDALHAPGIEKGIVSTLRSRRNGRQCIFATRNANILVSADAEQILALKADAHHGELCLCGSLDGLDHRQLVIYHVEGGEDAFNRRKTIYTLHPTP